jgi:hypothetical protein
MITVQEKQKKAQEVASSYGYDYVKFIKNIGNVSVYRGMTHEEKMLGLPLFIEIDDNGNIIEQQSLEYMELIEDEENEEK